ncbi:MAG: hypothetical protein A3J79_01615 [Elusimicrobia bacterium RIFOXYB2_FULL_62_6]|nr:MAG: hypothetical protein A3J79_01615 [Elusimicrobia bacterium RIFOXYB2_FULL_62_6]
MVSITAVSRSAGSLELAWTSPGADGFLGDVLNGAYRVDYTSDPAHAFSPSVYKLEFSTSVEANRPQALLIDGLEPNTTYYAKVYLADSRKFFAEDSRRGEKATLANVPVSPVFSGVAACSATITWNLPLGGAQAYSAEASSTNFGALWPGGAVKEASADGLKVSMTMTGLAPRTTYFFNLASLSVGGDKNFTTVLATVTPGGVCFAPCVAGLSLRTDPWSRAADLAWGVTSYPLLHGVLVLLSTSPAVSGIADGQAFSPKQVLADNSFVRSTAAAVAFNDSGLALDTTYFYHLFAQYDSFNYSVSVSTSFFLDLPPMAPGGLTSALSADGASMTLNWSPVTGNKDGSLFYSTDTPRPVELAQYRIERATSVMNAAWVTVATVPVTALTYTDALPDPDQHFIYRVTAADSLGEREPGMAVDTERKLYAFAPDGVTRFVVPQSLTGELMTSSGEGQEWSGILIRATAENPSATPKTLASVRFEAVKVPQNEVLDGFTFSKPDVDVVIKYPGSASPSPAAPGSFLPSEAVDSLGMYWNDSEKYIKLFGRVDPAARTVSVKSAMTGSYQVRSLYRESGVSFDISGLSNRVITPNGDGLNDAAVFTFNNPKDSGFSGKIYDINGAFVADMTAGPVSDSLQWDGRKNGRAVAGDVYVYQIRGEEKVFNGTLVVIR